MSRKAQGSRNVERWRDGIAIVGMSARFPGCRSVDEYWKKIAAGESLLTSPTAEELRAAGMDPRLAEPELAEATHFVRSGTTLEDADRFDAKFFELSRREAEILDPQQRILLEVAYEALEHAGIAGDGERVGVFAGAGMNSYIRQILENPEALEAAGGYQLMLGNDKDFAATRIAYKLNLRGPAVVVQTACSTSLAAVHLACQSLLNGECDAALAGGVSVAFPQVAGYAYMPGMILSPDGICRPFDERAAGTVPGRGAGMVVLKRLADAERDGDTVYAVIAGSAWNNDGSDKVGYTAPSVDGQAEVIRGAYAAAGIGPERIGYIEAHGTGTELGDPIEVAALASVFAEAAGLPGGSGSIVLGSVKANMGHADVAAGVAGLIKAAMSVHTGVIPPTPHFERANPALGLEETPFRVSAETQSWGEGERWAGVSSFGIGGTNVHLCLRGAPVRDEPEAQQGPWVFPVSAKTGSALEAGVARLNAAVMGLEDAGLAAVAATLQSGRRSYGFRRAVVAASAAELTAALAGKAAKVEEIGGAEVAFLFPGQGLQFRGMAAALFARDARFRKTVEAGLAVLPLGLAAEIRAAIEDQTEDATMRTGLAQPLLFLVEYALAVRWMDVGVRPAALLGHSLGELTAAAVAGVFGFEDGLRLAAERGRLMEATPEGAMLAVSLPADAVSRELPGDLWIAAENAPKLTVVSGSVAAIEAFAGKLASRRVAAMRVRTDRAFHTPDMAEAAAKFETAVAAVERKAPRLRWLSNVTGTWITADEAVSARYWADQMTARVRFAENAAVLASAGAKASFSQAPEMPGMNPRPTRYFLLEVGPGDALTGLVRAQAKGAGAGAILAAASSLDGPKRRGDDFGAFLSAAARLWECGAELDWERMPGYPGKRRMALPTYPFERERYWVESAAKPGPAKGARDSGWGPTAGGVALVRRDDLDSWFYSLTWRKTPAAGLVLPAVAEPVGTWVVVGEAGELDAALIAGLERSDARVLRLGSGSREGLEAFWAEHREDGGVWGLVVLCADSSGAKAPVVLGDGFRGLKPPAPSVTTVSPSVSTFPIPAASASIVHGFADDLYTGLLEVLQTATRARVRFAQVELIAGGLAEVSGEAVTGSRRGVLEGLVRMLPAEFAGVRTRVIDPGFEFGLSEDANLTAELIVAELATRAAGGTMVALRKGVRWQEEWMPVRLGAGRPSRFRQGGTYLITGGLGGVGYVMARHLLRTYGAKVTLLGRTLLPAREQWEPWLTEHGPDEATSVRIARAKELEAAREQGGELLLIAADVADRGAMAAALTEIETKLGPVHGVIHAAGLTSNERVMVQSAASAERVLRPKVQGSEVLAEILTGKPLDFLAFCSSISAIHPAPGGAAYAAANAFQDRYAIWCRQHLGIPAVSINLDTWRDVGMAAELYAPDEFAEVKRALMAKAMSPEEGVEAMERVLATGEPRMLISTFELAAVFADTEARLYAGPKEPAGTTESNPGNGLARTPETEAVMAIWRELLGAEWVAPDDNFFELGGHSLLGTMVLARIREQFGVALTIRAIFEAPTPELLGERIRQAEPVLEEEQAVGTGGEREEFEI